MARSPLLGIHDSLKDSGTVWLPGLACTNLHGSKWQAPLMQTDKPYARLRITIDSRMDCNSRGLLG